MVRQAALGTKGAGGPSEVDANGFRRMLACKSFKQSSIRLCDAIEEEEEEEEEEEFIVPQ